MTTDVGIILWKETREFLHSQSRLLRFGAVAVVLALGSVLILNLGGTEARSPGMLFFATPVLMVVFMANSSTEIFAGERERRTLEALLATRISPSSVFAGKLLFLALGALVLGGASLALGMAFLASNSRLAVFVSIFLSVGLPALLGGLAVGLAYATLGGFISTFARTVRQANMVIALLLLPLFITAAQLMPQLRDTQVSFWWILLAVFGVDLVFIALAMSFARRRVILRA